MFLIFINELGPNYKKENIYEFIFSEDLEELWGDEWDSVPAHGKPGPPEVNYIQKVGVLSQSTIKLELVQNSDYFGMEHALDKIISLGWEISEEDEINEDRLVFHFGEKLKDVENKLYARDLILDYDKNITYVE
jgi:hypothetical protein|tara:strand:- start:3034 stop:3435 length:402 start_codon:yes stop_codon:yes gene_type:complete